MKILEKKQVENIKVEKQKILKEEKKVEKKEINQLWVDKYKPKNIDTIIDNKKNIEDITTWLNNWNKNFKKNEKSWKKR
jgi:hypothetical protein